MQTKPYCWVALWLATLAAPAAAQPAGEANTNAARELATQAQAAADAGQLAEAEDLYRRAYALYSAPTIAVRHARVLARLGRLVEAEEAYRRTLRAPLDASAPEPFRAAVEVARTELAELTPRIPKLRVVPLHSGKPIRGAEVKVDGERLAPALVGVAYKVDPGEHEISTGSTSRKVTLAERQVLAVEIEAPAEAGGAASAAPEPAGGSPGPRRAPARAEAPPPPAGTPTLAWISLGVGAAGLATGVVAGMLATSRYSAAEEACPARRCVEGSSGASDLEAFRSLRTVSTVGYVVGAIGVGAGVTLWLTAPSAEGPATQAFVGVGHAGIRGSF
ncbi:MAG: hypothetical protein IT376_09830 [Polyangiaceae bacterium]|nr:hypothetical protein [Polyangiaceae bacterium]